MNETEIEMLRRRVAQLESEVEACKEDEKELFTARKALYAIREEIMQCRDKCVVLEGALAIDRDLKEEFRANCEDLSKKNRLLVRDVEELRKINNNLGVEVVALRAVIRDLAGK